MDRGDTSLVVDAGADATGVIGETVVRAGDANDDLNGAVIPPSLTRVFVHGAGTASAVGQLRR